MLVVHAVTGVDTPHLCYRVRVHTVPAECMCKYVLVSVHWQLLVTYLHRCTIHFLPFPSLHASLSVYMCVIVLVSVCVQVSECTIVYLRVVRCVCGWMGGRYGIVCVRERGHGCACMTPYVQTPQIIAWQHCCSHCTQTIVNTHTPTHTNNH